MNYKQAVWTHIAPLLRCLESGQTTTAEFLEKIDLIRLALLHHAADTPGHQPTVEYCFKRLRRYAESGCRDRAGMLTELYLMEMLEDHPLGVGQ